MSDTLNRLSSRKFLLAVSATSALFAAKQYSEAVGVVAAYILGQAGVDVTTAVKEVRKGASAAEGHSAG